jgi:hypothetical protein
MCQIFRRDNLKAVYAYMLFYLLREYLSWLSFILSKRTASIMYLLSLTLNTVDIRLILLLCERNVMTAFCVSR